MSSTAVAFHNVEKRYPFFHLDRLSFRLETGQIMGLVGPNGAGKSTCMKLLSGLIEADAGEVEVLGHRMPAGQVEAKWQIGHVSEDMRLFSGATLGWHLDFVAAIYPGWDAGYAQHLLRHFGLRGAQRVKTLSRGEHMKALLLLALARRPALLVLDEPTSGLDPVARQEVIGELMEVVQDDRRSILFSSHNTLEVEQICDQVTFLDRGRLVDSRDKEAFIERWRRLSVSLDESQALPDLPGVVETQRSGRLLQLTCRDFQPELTERLQALGAEVLEIQRMSLEEIFVANVMAKRREMGE